MKYYCRQTFVCLGYQLGQTIQKVAWALQKQSKNTGMHPLQTEILFGQIAGAKGLNENPIFADVSVYNRTVMTPQSLPHVVDEAIKAAYEHKGVIILAADFC